MMKDKVFGYLPDDKPKFGKAVLFALQQFLVMLPATVLAAILMNGSGVEIYSIPAAVFASGVATLAFIFVTKGKIPLYYGSSFAYIPAIGIVVTNAGSSAPDTIFGAIMIASLVSGLMSIGAGLLIRTFGSEKLDAILPGHITGMVAMIIGLSLAGNTMSDFGILFPNGESSVNWPSVLVALITFLTVAILTVVLKKGFISQITILIGLGIGVIFSYLIYVPSLKDGGYFENISYYINHLQSGTIGLFDHLPHKTIPAAFENPSLILTTLLAIFPIAFATIPESAAHVNQVDLYVNDLAQKMDSNKRYPIKNLLDVNLIGDGIGDMVAVLFGGPAGTNYGENVSASAVTKNFSSYVFKITGVLALFIGVLLHLIGNLNISQLLTTPVIQGISLYLFGAIAVQGIALMIDKRVDVFNPRVIAVMAFISIVALGAPANGIVVSSKFILPGIGVAAFGGILINLGLLGLEKLFQKKA